MILFLDFDGVLHPDTAYLIKGRPVLHGEGELFMWVPLLEDVLSSHPEVQIVLSTSWARDFGFTRARRYLPASLRNRTIGATWHSAMAFEGEYRSRSRNTWWDLHNRYQQIRRYVERAGLAHWVAVDDQPHGWDAADNDHLVQTNPDTGLSDPAVIARLHRLLETGS
ncbi:HAD domain-containing protein [Leeia aquatica]|uniref:Secreted protein n=1 Tax=Leeia aquatica TaxID=2725557 RepID=A0A847S606_9NEIS|nr:HAD domain-containing protein [Leeia aquatica]NLR75304.1 hypothetical protein [Leeia aquatica]